MRLYQIYFVGLVSQRKGRTPGTSGAGLLSGQLLQVSLHVGPDLLGLGPLELGQDAHLAVKVQN